MMTINGLIVEMILHDACGAFEYRFSDLSKLRMFFFILVSIILGLSSNININM